MKKIFPLILILFASASPLLAGYFESGTAYYKAKNYPRAKELLIKETEVNPSNGSAWYFLGEAYKETGAYPEAEAAFRKAVSSQIQRKYLSLAYWNLLVLVEQRNNIGDLIKICREFTQATGDDSPKRKVDEMINKMIWTDNQAAIDLFKAAEQLRDQNKSAEAKQKYQEALSADSAFLAPHFNLGQMLYNEGKEAEAAQHFRIIADKIPYYSSVHLMLADIYFKGKSYPAAADSFEKALEYGFFDRQTRFAAYVKLASSRFASRDYEKASAAGDEALKINPGDKEALMLMSAVDIKLERYDDALKTLTKLQSVDSENPDIIYQIGSIYYKQQNAEKYSRYFEQLFNVSTKGNTPLPSKYYKAMQILAKYYFSNNNYTRCIDIISALPESARDNELILSAAKSHYLLRQYDASVPLFEKLTLNADDRFMLCKAYVKANMKPKAKSSLISLIGFNSSYKDKALADQILAPLVKEINADQQRAQDQQNRLLQQQNQALPAPQTPPHTASPADSSNAPQPAR